VSDVSLDIRVEEDPVNFYAEGVDLRLSYGSTYYAGFRQIPLINSDAIAVCAPEFWQQFRDPKGQLLNVPDELFIHNNWGNNFATAPSWHRWMANAGLPAREFDSVLQFNDITLAVAAARRGIGIALAPLELLASDLVNGSLTMPSSLLLKSDKHYVALFPDSRSDYPPLRQFLSLVHPKNSDRFIERGAWPFPDTGILSDGH